MRDTWWSRAYLAAALLFGTPQTSMAQHPAADFYRGKQIRILPGFGPGGSSSLYAQALARHMGRHLPGAPTFIVQNMPGAGGLVVVNYMNTNAPRDGTEFAISSRTAAMEPLLGNANAKFDPREFGWIGNATSESSVCVSWHTSPVKTVDDLFTKELVVGGTGSDAMEVLIPRAVNNLLGTKINVVTGYPSSTEIFLAMERGEVSGFCGVSWALLSLRKSELLQDKKVNILFQISLTPPPEIKSVPLIQDLSKTPEQRQILEFLTAPQELGRTFFAPPNVPQERLRALRDAFMKTMEDPKFLEDAAKQGLVVNPVRGEDVQKLVERIYATPNDLIQKAKAASQGAASK